MGQSYRELIAWQKAMNFVMDVYGATRLFPRDEVYALASQGQARFSSSEFHYFLSCARGALVEVETQLIIAQNLKYVTPDHGQRLLDKAAELGRILNDLISSIKPAA